MTGRERILAAFEGERPDHYGAFEHYWGEAIDLWKTQGLPSDVDPADYFQLDLRTMCWFDTSFQFPVETVAEEGDYIIERNNNGVLLKRHKTESGHTPHWLDHKVCDRNSWEKYKDRLVMNDDRVALDPGDLSRELRDKGLFVCLAGTEPYECFWSVFGQANLFMLMLDDPELVKDVFHTAADLLIQIIDRYHSDGVYFDGVWFYGDVGYRNGTLFSGSVYDSMLAEPHRRLCDYVHSIGKKVILHSCGRIESFIPRFIEAGFDAIQPLEAKCGQDIRDLIPEYGRQTVFFGNMDVRALSGTRADVEAEIVPKLEATRGTYNYIFHSDHSVPQTVSFDSYCYALELVRGFKP